MGSSVIGRIAVGPIILAVIAFGCSDASPPTAPTYPRDDTRVFSECAPAGDGLRCTARLVGATERDVTSAAIWWATPAEAVRFTAPGAVVPIERADVRIIAAYQGLQSSDPAMYRVAPGTPARELAYFGFTVTDTAGAPIPALVEVLSGTGAGMSCRPTGIALCTVGPVVVGEAMTVRASADGYANAERTLTVTRPSIAAVNRIQLTPLP